MTTLMTARAEPEVATTGHAFGGGATYVFRCAGCDIGAFLWQR